MLVMPGRYQRGFTVKWIIIFVIYYLIGIGVLVWRTNKDKRINPKSKIFPKKIFILFLFDLVCLLWPFVLFSEMKHKRTENHVVNDDIE